MRHCDSLSEHRGVEIRRVVDMQGDGVNGIAYEVG